MEKDVHFLIIFVKYIFDTLYRYLNIPKISYRIIGLSLLFVTHCHYSKHEVDKVKWAEEYDYGKKYHMHWSTRCDHLENEKKNKFNMKSTFQDLSIIQIWRENSFGDSRSFQNCQFCNFKSYEFCFKLENFNLQKVQ